MHNIQARKVVKKSRKWVRLKSGNMYTSKVLHCPGKNSDSARLMANNNGYNLGSRVVDSGGLSGGKLGTKRWME